MSQQEPTIQRVAIIGTGVIGASWAAYFLARGMHVAASDPAPNAEAELHRLVQSFWPALQQQGLAPGASLERLRFASSIANAVADADFIQENGPERLDIKHRIVAEIEAATRDDVIIASSSSGLLMSDMQQGAKHPERIVLGHPFNPPHLIPLVEVVAGKQTSAETVAIWAKGGHAGRTGDQGGRPRIAGGRRPGVDVQRAVLRLRHAEWRQAG